jgi:hypothetical protein
VSRIASAKVPTILVSILTYGDLLALHKLDVAEQVKAREDGIPPSLRPVNKGCNLLNYLAQVTPPSLTAQHFADFDIHLAAQDAPLCRGQDACLPPPSQTAHASQRSWLGRRRQHCRCLRRLGYRHHVR